MTSPRNPDVDEKLLAAVRALLLPEVEGLVAEKIEDFVHRNELRAKSFLLWSASFVLRKS